MAANAIAPITQPSEYKALWLACTSLPEDEAVPTWRTFVTPEPSDVASTTGSRATAPPSTARSSAGASVSGRSQTSGVAASVTGRSQASGTTTARRVSNLVRDDEATEQFRKGSGTAASTVKVRRAKSVSSDSDEEGSEDADGSDDDGSEVRLSSPVVVEKGKGRVTRAAKVRQVSSDVEEVLEVCVVCGTVGM